MIYSQHFVAQVAKSNFVDQIRKGVLVIDNSEYSTWDSCFAMGVYSGGLRRVNARARAPLAFGGAVHVGIDAYLNGNEKWRDLALADAAITGLDELGDPKRNTTKLLNLLESYFLEYSRNKSMQFDILKVAGQAAVEQSFSVPLGQITCTFERQLTVVNVVWSGKIDLLTNYEGAITPVDHKTTTVMGEKFIDDKIRGNQMLGYTYAARYLSQKLFGEKPVFGVRINTLAMRQSGYEFKIFDIPFPDWKVAEWQKEVLGSIEDLVTHLDKFLTTGQVVPTREHCVTKYGKCPYFDVCDSPAIMRDRMIFDDSYYFISEWSPLND
jgi:hypothetical protein